jgi:hypothetical protein
VRISYTPVWRSANDFAEQEKAWLARPKCRSQSKNEKPYRSLVLLVAPASIFDDGSCHHTKVTNPPLLRLTHAWREHWKFVLKHGPRSCFKRKKAGRDKRNQQKHRAPLPTAGACERVVGQQVGRLVTNL